MSNKNNLNPPNIQDEEKTVYEGEGAATGKIVYEGVATPRAGTNNTHHGKTVYEGEAPLAPPPSYAEATAVPPSYSEAYPPPKYNAVVKVEAIPDKIDKWHENEQKNNERKITNLEKNIKATVEKRDIIQDIVEQSIKKIQKSDKSKINSSNIESRAESIELLSGKILNLKGISNNTRNYFEKVSQVASNIKENNQEINEIKNAFDSRSEEFVEKWSSRSQFKDIRNIEYNEDMKYLKDVGEKSRHSEKTIKEGENKQLPPAYKDVLKYSQMHPNQSSNKENLHENSSDKSSIDQPTKNKVTEIKHQLLRKQQSLKNIKTLKRTISSKSKNETLHR